MNQILMEVEKILRESIKTHLPDVKEEHLEENGAVYYMNGKNGTEFDWHVNEKISDFMVFYNDEDNLGAAKLTLYTDGAVLVYVYGDRGKTVCKEVRTEIEVPESEILKLAVVLKKRADDLRIWDRDIRQIDVEAEITDAEIKEFSDNAKLFEGFVARKKMFSQMAYVSKKILAEGWKVGYMVREEALHEQDSGWSFLAGNEEDDYCNDSENIALLEVGRVCQLDSDVLAYIDNPAGSAFIRVSSDKFEKDTGKKPIFLEKR